MGTTVAQMTKEELSSLIDGLIENKLLELLDESDEGLELRDSIRARLLSQRKSGERGELFEDVVDELRIE